MAMGSGTAALSVKVCPVLTQPFPLSPIIVIDLHKPLSHLSLLWLLDVGLGFSRGLGGRDLSEFWRVCLSPADLLFHQAFGLSP